jgi:monoamine oxidase
MASPRVVIVGAGAAGLAAASRLFRSGLQRVTLLEAADRIGGRVHSVNVDYRSAKTTEDERRHTVELGAQWVHGKVDNVSFGLASKEGLLEDQDAEEDNPSGEFDGKHFY